jgi:hypothetical protein
MAYLESVKGKSGTTTRRNQGYYDLQQQQGGLGLGFSTDGGGSRMTRSSRSYNYDYADQMQMTEAESLSSRPRRMNAWQQRQNSKSMYVE